FFGTYSPSYLTSGAEEFGKLQAVYGRLGQPARIAWREAPLPQGLSYDSRLENYQWITRWQKSHGRTAAEESPVHPEEGETLWVAESGNMVRTFGSKTPFQLNKERTPPRLDVPLTMLLGVTRPASSIRASVLRRVPSRSVDVEAWEVNSDSKVWIPAWMFL